jgi:hypothetical protein
LRWRLGVAPPPDFPDRLADGESYASATAYEILTAINKRKACVCETRSTTPTRSKRRRNKIVSLAASVAFHRFRRRSN